MVNLDDLERLLAEATPGEWGADGPEWCKQNNAVSAAFIRAIEPEQDCVVAAECYWKDAAAIVALMNAASQLIAEAKAGRELAGGVRQWSRRKLTRDYHPIEQLLDAYDAGTLK